MKETHGEGLHYPEEPRIFAMFFMVLDLRLVKIGCRETINFFVPTPSLACSPLYFPFPIPPSPTCRKSVSDFVFASPAPR